MPLILTGGIGGAAAADADLYPDHTNIFVSSGASGSGDGTILSPYDDDQVWDNLDAGVRAYWRKDADYAVPIPTGIPDYFLPYSRSGDDDNLCVVAYPYDDGLIRWDCQQTNQTSGNYGAITIAAENTAIHGVEIFDWQSTSNGIGPLYYAPSVDGGTFSATQTTRFWGSYIHDVINATSDNNTSGVTLQQPHGDFDLYDNLIDYVTSSVDGGNVSGILQIFAGGGWTNPSRYLKVTIRNNEIKDCYKAFKWKFTAAYTGGYVLDFRHNYIHTDPSGMSINPGEMDIDMFTGRFQIHHNIIVRATMPNQDTAAGAVFLRTQETALSTGETPFVDCEVFQNTVWQQQQCLLINDSGVNVSDMLFRGNILHGNNQGNNSLMIATSTGSAPVSVFTSDYNCGHDLDYWGREPANAGASTGTLESLSTWETGNSLDGNSITTDPTFVDQANDDYRLDTGSPAIGTGYLGRDMGAYENSGGYGNPPGMVTAKGGRSAGVGGVTSW